MNVRRLAVIPTALALLAGLGGLGGPARASLAKRMSLEQLAGRAERVVVARLIERHSAWGPEHKRIWTRLRFAVERDVAGGGAAELTVVQPGGTVGRWTQRVAGYPRFAEPGPVLLLLRRGRVGWQVVGMCQGVFGLHHDRGRELLVQRLAGLDFHGDPGRPLLLEREQALARIRAVFNRGGQP